MPARRPYPQYVFRRRGDRQRMAIRLAGGMGPEKVAAVERMAPVEVERLLGDDGFRSLVEHHRALMGLSREERVAKLADLALDILQEALVAGDVRVALFYRRAIEAGEDPSRELAQVVERARERAVTAPPPAPPEDDRIAAEDRAFLPEAAALSAARAAPASEENFPFCAATLPSAADAEALLLAEAPRLHARIDATAAGLARRLRGEAERIGTATGPVDLAASRHYVAGRHEDGVGSLEAARRLALRREASKAGRVAGMGEAEGHLATLPRRSGGVADAAPPPDRAIGRGDDRRGIGGAPASPSSSSGSMGGPASPTPMRSSGRSASPSEADATASAGGPAEGRHSRDVAADPAAPSPGAGPREGPAPPARLPDWVDQVPGASRARLLAMPEPVRAETLRVWAGFYGFDTS